MCVISSFVRDLFTNSVFTRLTKRGQSCSLRRNVTPLCLFASREFRYRFGHNHKVSTSSKM